MINFENAEVMGWEAAIRGMRNPKNSWSRSDSSYICPDSYDEPENFIVYLGEMCGNTAPLIGINDRDLMTRLADGGAVHAKYRRMITVYVDITAPLYW